MRSIQFRSTIPMVMIRSSTCGDSPTAVHNHEVDPEGIYWDWDYLYGVGGTTNHWTGTTPMFLPEDFEMKSRYGVMR